MATSEQEVLTRRLGQYPVGRYPVQHATTQFHLGSTLLHAGEVAVALGALTVARDVFGRAGMVLETAKSTVMLGAALRLAGRGDEAEAAFRAACTELGGLDQPAEQAAAAYNLGLVRQDGGDLDGAHAAWDQARTLFLTARYPAQAAAAARDHGASLLGAGRVGDALPLLEQALELAEQAGDEPGVGAAANTLGLARLAAQEPLAAVAALRRALAASPASTRPADHSMAKANLALAHEQAGDRSRARLAAVQALAVPSIPAPVRAQAQQLLGRLPGQVSQDLWTVLDGTDAEQWAAVLREEVLRVSDLPDGQRRAMVGGFLDGVLARPGASYDLTQTLLQIVVEQPPRVYDRLVRAVVDACGGRPDVDSARLRAVIGSALARFALPQWQRLAASLNAAAREAGQPATWS